MLCYKNEVITMATNRFQEGKKIFDYFPEIARSKMTKREARAEYARLRKIANRRLEALMRHYPKSEVAKRYRKGFAPLGRAERSSRIYKKLYEVARYLNTATGSVSGQRTARKKQLETLREHGYTFVNKKNLDEFNEFWRTVRAHGGSAVDGQSETIAELFAKAKKAKLDPQTVAKAFEKYLAEDSPLDKVKINYSRYE